MDGADQASESGATPPSEEALQSLGSMIYQFRVALANLSLYAAGSQQAMKACSGMYDPLAVFLEAHKSLTLSDTPDALLVNGTPLQLPGPQGVAAAFFATVLRRAGIKSLTFRIGLTLDEVYRFLDWIHQRRLDREGAEPAGEVVPPPKEGFGHISFNERVFVSISDEDIVVQGGGGKLAQAQAKGAVEEVMKEVQRMMDLSSVEDPALRDKVRMEIARQIVKADPTILTKLGSETGDAPPAPAAEGPGGLLQLPGDMVRETVAQLAHAYRSLAASLDAAGPAGPGLAQLKKAVGRLLGLTAGREEMGALYQQIMQSGGADLVPGGAFEAPPPAQRLEDHAQELVAGDSLRILDDEIRAGLPSLIGALDMSQRTDLAERLFSRMAENLGASTVSIRKKAAASLRDLMAAAAKTSRPGMADHLDPGLMKAQESESDAQVYRDLAGLLQDRASDLVGRGNLDRTAEILGLFRRHRNAQGGPFEDRAQAATDALRAIGGTWLTSLLIKDAVSGDPSRADKAREMMVKLEELGVGSLIQEIKGAEDLRTRRILVSLARNLGESALVRLASQFDEERSGRVLERLLEVAWDIGKDDLVFYRVPSLQSHPERRVRYKLVEMLRLKGTEQAGASIMAMLSDESKDIRLAAIAALGELRHLPALPALTALVSQGGLLERSEDPDIQAAACTALGRMGEESSVRTLVGALGGGLLSRLRPSHPSVRLAAVTSLTPFAHRPDVQEALRPLLNDAFLAVQHAASTALKGGAP